MIRMCEMWVRLIEIDTCSKLVHNKTVSECWAGNSSKWHQHPTSNSPTHAKPFVRMGWVKGENGSSSIGNSTRRVHYLWMVQVRWIFVTREQHSLTDDYYHRHIRNRYRWNIFLCGLHDETNSNRIHKQIGKKCTFYSNFIASNLLHSNLFSLWCPFH